MNSSKNNVHQNTEVGAVPRKEKHIKRPLNAYIIWCREEREKVSQENPRLSTSQVFERLGAHWKLLSDAQKTPYYKEAERLR